jgi:D-alanyl-lipoteichoic acid acyltransferase DltB (MBOAT superfamily)
MKVAMADTLLAGTANAVFGYSNSLPGLDAWMGVLAFSGQIFFDFAGYSTCAIAVAMCLGFVLPENFRYPYAAIGFTDFWRRWHITLSSWLRDYLYIPLGGNRRGKFNTYFNLMMTMLLGGLWHGASWTFVAWGALHGTYLCVEKWFKQIADKIDKPRIGKESLVRAGLAPVTGVNKGLRNFLLALGTFFLINVTWVFFRAKEFSTAWRLLASMFGFSKNQTPLLSTIDIIKVIVVVTGMFTAHWLMRNTTVLQEAKKLPWLVLALVWSFLVISIIVCQKSGDSFIYFQF